MITIDNTSYNSVHELSGIHPKIYAKIINTDEHKHLFSKGYCAYISNHRKNGFSMCSPAYPKKIIGIKTTIALKIYNNFIKLNPNAEAQPQTTLQSQNIQSQNIQPRAAIQPRQYDHE